MKKIYLKIMIKINQKKKITKKYTEMKYFTKYVF